MAGNLDQNEREFLTAFEENSDAIYRHCLFRVNDHEEAVDLTQEIFLRAWREAQKGEPVHNWKAFLYRVAHTRIIDTYRSAARQRNTSLDELRESGFDPADLTEDEQAEVSHVLAMLESLSQPDREIITMRYVDGLSPSEIAEALEINTNAASVRLNRAIKKLREELRI